MIGLSDKNGALRSLWRLHGSTHSPALVLKDKTGYDRLVIGLRASDELPYIEYTDSSGRKIDLLQQF